MKMPGTDVAMVLKDHLTYMKMPGTDVAMVLNIALPL
jgi:hypothetical protein